MPVNLNDRSTKNKAGVKVNTVGMPNRSGELHFGRPIWILERENHFAVENSTFTGTIRSVRIGVSAFQAKKHPTGYKVN
jgi:hypothetical protein